MPYVELDALNWEPNWVGLNETNPELFRSRIANAVSADAWVIDGNYREARDIVWPVATAVVWLDYPWRVVAWRLLTRTIGRLLTRRVLWGGNRESFRKSFLSRDSILLWALKTFGPNRRRYTVALSEPEHGHLDVYRHGRPGETEQWLTSLQCVTRERAA